MIGSKICYLTTLIQYVIFKNDSNNTHKLNTYEKLSKEFQIILFCGAETFITNV